MDLTHPLAVVTPTLDGGVLGVLMLAIFGHLRFGLYPRLVRAVAGQAWPAGAAALQTIRRWVMLNLGLGIVVVVVTLLGASS